MKKTALALVLLLWLATLMFAGCSDDYAIDSAWGGVANNEAGSDSAPYADDDSRSSYEVAGAEVPEFQRQVIRNAHMYIETTEMSAPELYAILLERANAFGGYETSSRSTNNEASSRITRRSSVNAVLRVPPEELDAFMRFVGENGHITSSYIDSDDVTAEFYDLQTRLGTKRSTLTAYFTLLENAQQMDDILRVQRMIDQITEEIEAVEGRLRVLNSRTGMATVTLDIYQVVEYTPDRREVNWSALTFNDMGWLIRDGFIMVVSTIATIVQWLIVFLAVTSPLWIPIVVITIVILRKGKGKRIKRMEEISARMARTSAASERENPSSEEGGEKNDETDGNSDSRGD
jgi:hypothetical protein